MEFKVSTKEFSSILDILSKDKLRPHLMHAVVSGGKIIATNTFALVSIELKSISDHPEIEEIFENKAITSDFLKEVKKLKVKDSIIYNKETKEFKIGYSIFKLPEYNQETREIENIGVYPNFKYVLPETEDLKNSKNSILSVNPELLLKIQKCFPHEKCGVVILNNVKNRASIVRPSTAYDNSNFGLIMPIHYESINEILKY